MVSLALVKVCTLECFLVFQYISYIRKKVLTNAQLVLSKLTKTHFFSSVCINDCQQSFGQSKSQSTGLANRSTLAD